MIGAGFCIADKIMHAIRHHEERSEEVISFSNYLPQFLSTVAVNFHKRRIIKL